MNKHYKRLLKEHKNWMKVLHYSPKTIYSATNSLTIIFAYFDSKEILNCKKVTKEQIDEFLSKLKNEKSKRTKRVLSNIQINSYINELKRLNTYLYLTYNFSLPINHLELLKVKDTQKEILTIEEVKQLFEVTTNDKIGLRDKVMLSLYYSCGLRRDEAIHVNLNDIDLNRRILHIRVSKFNKQRLVPLTEETVANLKEYLKNGRPLLQNRLNRKRKTLLLSERGSAIQSQSLAIRLKVLLKQAKITKNITLHSLRHSVATHLLNKGMETEDISTFLGHSSLESTQIYTHIEND